MVAYQQRGDGVMVKFRTPGEVLRWGGIGAEVEMVEGVVGGCCRRLGLRWTWWSLG